MTPPNTRRNACRDATLLSDVEGSRRGSSNALSVEDQRVEAGPGMGSKTRSSTKHHPHVSPGSSERIKGCFVA